jgi:hypothetical protein
VKLGLTAIALVALISSAFLSPLAPAQQQSAVPDAPTPQATRSLSDVNGPITPGKGASDGSADVSSSSSAPAAQTAPANQAPAGIVPPAKDDVQIAPPEMPAKRSKNPPR